MPIGVPKVPYRLSGDSTTQWVDLYNRLYRERILFLGSDLDDELANQLVGIMVYLDAEDDTKDLFLYINSAGGSVNSGFAVFDTISHLSANVNTICVGLAASMASLVLAGGTFGFRLAFPHSRVMLHQPSGGIKGQGSDIIAEKQEIFRLRDQIATLYLKLTGANIEQISTDLNRDFFLSAKAAKEYGSFGLVDRVAENTVFSYQINPIPSVTSNVPVLVK